MEKTLDTSGKVLNSRALGSVLNNAALRSIGETTNAAGQTVRRLQDASGSVLEVTLDAAGKVASSRVVSSPANATGGARSTVNAPR